MNTRSRLDAAPRSHDAWLIAAVTRAIAWLVLCHGRHSQRRQLAELDDDRLRDIGVTWEEARREARKPFWRA